MKRTRLYYQDYAEKNKFCPIIQHCSTFREILCLQIGVSLDIQLEVNKKI
jgi:hypothetical protein